MPTRPIIAIVDDDESIRDTTRDFLESMGMSAETYSGPSEFLTSGRLALFACLITDQRMPAMTGLELHLHLDALKHPIPTIIITAYPDERIRAKAREAKVLCFLTKPFEARALLACVRKAIKRRRTG